MFLMYAVTGTVITQQDNVSYDGNILCLVLRSRFL